MCDDTGFCVPESLATLLIQQLQLEFGNRNVQMFPNGTAELPLPVGIERHQNERGVFHYKAEQITPALIDELSSQGRENEYLGLGPYSKIEVGKRLKDGEHLMCVTEYTPAGVEVRSAGGTETTVEEQFDYFQRTKEPGNIIVVGPPPKRVTLHLMKG